MEANTLAAGHLAPCFTEGRSWFTSTGTFMVTSGETRIISMLLQLDKGVQSLLICPH